MALAINEGAYMSEIVRAGILSVDPGQTEAAKSLGMTYRLTMSRIVLPQALRVIIPPLGNEFNNMLKTTSLMSVIAVEELFRYATGVASATFKPFEAYLGDRAVLPRADHDLEHDPEPDRAPARGRDDPRRRAGPLDADARAVALSRRPGTRATSMVEIANDILAAIGGVPRPDTDVVVEATDVDKWFGKVQVLKGVSMTVKRAEVVVMIGASGSGKTTFIRCINHLEKIQGGRIFVNGHLIGYREENGKLVEDREQNIARQRQDIGMVFQRFNLFPHMTALGNVIEAPIRVRGHGREGGDSRSGGRCSSGSGWGTRRTPIPRSCPAASSSAWRSPGRWR